MRLRSRLVGLVAGAVLLGMLAIAAVLTMAQREDDAAEVQSRAERVAHEVVGLLALTQEYARDGGSRAAEQWHQRHRAIAAALDGPSVASQGGASLTEFRRVVAALPSLFERLEAMAPSDEPLAERRKAALLEPLLTSTRAMSDHAYQWSQDAALDRGRLEKQFARTAIGVVALTTIALILIALMVQRKVLAPMAELDRAAAAVAQGDLTFRLASTRRDEFGDLARQFDAMVSALGEARGRIVRSEAQLRAITDNLPAMIAYIGVDGRYEFANDRFREWLKHDPAMMIGRRVEEVVKPPHAEIARANVGKALAGTRVQWEGQVSFPSGERFFLADYIPDIAADGSVRGVFALTIDISERRRAEIRVAAGEQRLLDLMNHIPAMVGYFDMQGHCQYANESGLRSLGLDRSEVPGLSLRAALGESGYAQHEPYVREALQGRRARFDGVMPFQGRPAHFQAHLIPDASAGGAQRGFYLMTFDITAMKEAQLQQSRIERRLRAITDNLPVLITYIDSDERYGFVNQTVQHWLGVEPTKLMGKKVGEAVPQAMPEALQSARAERLRRALRGERVHFEATVETLGVTRCLQTTYIPDIQSDGSIAGVYTLSTDVTAMKDVERQLGLLVRSDTLTGLPNRYQFNEALPMALARAARSGLGLALMFLDIDHFKSINDTLGHAAGDAVLREFAERLRRSVRTTDTVARLAGDEFVITLEGLHNDRETGIVAQKILAQMRPPFEMAGECRVVTTSIGIAFHIGASDATTPERLLAKADEALYAAKQAGRNTYRGTLSAPLQLEGMRA